MAVTIVSIEAIAPTVFDVTYSSDLGGTPTFWIYQDGEFVTTTTETVWQFVTQPGVSLLIDILDTADLPVAALSGRATLSWDAAADTDHYRVQELVSSTWTLRQRVQDTNVGSYSFRSRWLEDETTHQFRVVAVGRNDEQASARAFSVLIVRNPDAVTPTLTFNDETGAIDVEAA